jgi:hypothetical protein
MNQRDLRSPRSLLAGEVVPSPNGSLRGSTVACQHLFEGVGGRSAWTLQSVGSRVQKTVLPERPLLLPTSFSERLPEALLPSSSGGVGPQPTLAFRSSVSPVPQSAIRSSTARRQRQSFSEPLPPASVASSEVVLGQSHRSIRSAFVACQRPGPRRRGPANGPRLERRQKRTGRPTPRCSGRLTQSQAIMNFRRYRFEEPPWPPNGRR